MDRSDMGWVVDIGGTNIRLALVHSSGTVVWESRDRTPEVPEPSKVLDVVEGLMQKSCELPTKVRGMVFGVPGLVDSENGVALLNSNLSWRNVPLRRLAEDRFRVPAIVENDVRLHTLGEWKYGAGRVLEDGQNLADVVIGTGVAAGLVVHGQLLRTARSGEFGHLTWDRSGAPCGCGKVGCVETVVGAKALKRLSEQAGRPVQNFIEDIVKPLERNEPWARSLWGQFVEGLAFGLSNLVMVVSPEVIVLSGGVASSFSLWQSMLLSALSKELFEGALSSFRLVGSTLGDRAPSLGGRYLLFGDNSGECQLQCPPN